MGKKNRHRRAARAGKRHQQQARRRQQRLSSSPEWATVADLLTAAVHAHRTGRVDRVGDFVDELLDLPPSDVAEEVGRLLEQSVSSRWEYGWQPADVLRLTGRELGNVEEVLVRAAIASEAAGYEQWGRAVAPEWMAQLEAVGAERQWSTGQQWVLRVETGWHETLAAGVRVLAFLAMLPPLPYLMPPPSRWPQLEPRQAAEAARLDPGLLTRIRALLAKAESTEFDAEAESFTAKAQELMTRHRIDRATLVRDDETPQEVSGRRVGVDNPYAETKAILLGGIALANSCRAVWSKQFGFATVFGLPEDVDGVEELYTSLLVQATAALQREGSKVDGYGRSRTTRFRRSFLVGFSARISSRLSEASDAMVRQAERETGVALVPLLDSRDRAAEEAMRSTMSGLRGMSVSASDGEGYYMGQQAAEEADLTFGPTPELASTSRSQTSSG